MSGIVIAGFCPMGCGQTLQVRGGRVLCANSSCPDGARLHDIINDAETEHIAVVHGDWFQLLHPLRERPGNLVFECELRGWLKDQGSPPLPPGKYRVSRREPDAYSEAYRPVYGPWEYEEIEEVDSGESE